MFGREVPAF